MRGFIEDSRFDHCGVRRGMWWLILVMMGEICAAQDVTEARGPSAFLNAIPAGYSLHAYDDCGVPERQPHVLMQDTYCFTLATSDTDADLKSRSAVFSYQAVKLQYQDLDPGRTYLLVLTYASDHVYKRVQSLWANDVQLHGPLALPQAQAIRRIVRVPRAVTQSGQLDLQIRIHGEVNATASIVELWADGPPKMGTLQLSSVSGLVGDLTGQVQDIAFEPVADAQVQLGIAGVAQPLAVVRSQADGWFRFTRALLDQHRANGEFEICAVSGDRSVTQRVPAAQLEFEAVRYRPLPTAVGRLDEFHQSLDGTWRIDPQPTDDVRERPLDDPSWNDLSVPGQWKQQGFDIPTAQRVAMGREFAVAENWSGHRIFLRFDAIHAGTDYWLNGQHLGHSERLFTPVEWEITSLVRFGATNRLDLSMQVDTMSERLSYSSNYAFHNLGGIDRSVRLFALPAVHIKNLSVDSPLDEAYQNGELQLSLTLDNPNTSPVRALEVMVQLFDTHGQELEGTSRSIPLESVEPGERACATSILVREPSKWSAEHPHLYTIAVSLSQAGQLLERVERRIGFRTIEVRGNSLLVNGVAVKLAGACHHETDPLTGRADTMRHAENDIKQLKEANLNYVRTSHYPPTMELVEAADKFGMYLEVEAPFCWVGPQDDLLPLREILTPTSAMIDFYQSHPSVVIWSLANESHFNRFFEVSNELVKKLDPSRPTTFNNPDPGRVCDIANLHYPPMPYDEQLKEDPRPLLLGEYFFPVCHEQTEVRINPGLREYFGFGHSDPNSAWGEQCAVSFTKPYLKPCAPPGTWSHMVHSPRVLGGAIWAALDEAYYFPDGTHAGYAWHHGFWGIIDAWRRPKPEWWLTKLVFAPVWFPVREVDVPPGQTRIRVPVENRYAFTNLRELTFTWRVGEVQGNAEVDVPPGARGELEIMLPPDSSGQRLRLEVHAADGRLVNIASIELGPPPAHHLPQPHAGAPRIIEDGSTVVIQGRDFALVFDRQRGELVADDPRHQSACVRFPQPHLTRYDFGDLAGPHGKPYAVFPEEEKRVVEQVDVVSHPQGVELRVREHYGMLSGTMSWLIDNDGIGRITYHYTYHGEPLDTREAGVRFVVDGQQDEIFWHRWSEWDGFPADSISRTEGRAHALRDGIRGDDPEGVRPTWPWSQDQTSLGTADFRAIKFNVYEAGLRADNGRGLQVHANADRHVRACLAEDTVRLHVLTRCELGQVVMQEGDTLEGECTVELVGGKP
ncbi:MAG: glycoside hydrolase family 2 protein [Pirellulaceae bacterium]